MTTTGVQRRYQFKAIDANGAVVSDQVLASDRTDALRKLSATHSTVIGLQEIGGAESAGSFQLRPAITTAERLLVLQLLAVMTKAGVELLEALDIVAASLAGRPISNGLRDAAASLRRGESLSKALEKSVPGYPLYVYALMRAGESSGQLGNVIDQAAKQFEYEDRVRRDVANALMYPAFLVCSGLLSIGFLFYVVVPRFSEMLTNANAHLSGLSALVISAGNAFHSQPVPIIAGILLTIFVLATLANTAGGKRFLSDLANATPGVRHLLATRERASWSRTMAIALGAGVGILEAASLAAACLPPGERQNRALQSIQILRSGRPVDEAFVNAGVLAPVDASLVRAGQRSGALAEMFRNVADRNENAMRDALKRLTVLVEPIAIGLVALMVGAIVIGLVSALTSIYESIG
ncbi:MAG: type II secretion system F family protein [Terricaulis sp.]